MKKNFFFLAIFCSCLFSLSAQSSEKLTQIISNEELSFSEAAYLCGVYSDAVNEMSSFQGAFVVLQENGLIGENYSADQKISVSQFAYLCAKSVNLKGGFFYTLFPSPRYAFKELQAKSIIPSAVDPSSVISGRNAIAVLNGCINYAEKSTEE